jgi:anthranilate phosphoribosyltransferase
MHLVMAQVLATRGVDGFVFRGDDGLDEITLSSTTSILSIGNGEIRSDLIEPSDFGISRAPVSELVGGDATENARITLAIFSGERGAPRDAVLLNAAAAIAAFEGEQELSVHERITRGLKRAETAIDSGATTALLQKWISLTQSLVVPS